MKLSSGKHSAGAWLLAGASILSIFGCGAAQERTPIAAAAPPAVVHPETWPRVESAVAQDPDLERTVADLLAAMSVEDKVGQVIQAEIRSVTPEDVRRYRLGSVLNGGGSWPGNDKHAAVEDWLALADAFWEASMDTSGGGRAIPVIWGLDAVHGHGNVVGSTLFPHNIGLGAARDPELVRAIGEATAQEIVVTGQDWNFGPCVAVARDDRWGRTYESWSEDPEIVAAYAAAMVEGLQGAAGSDDFLRTGRVVATAKHFLGDGGTAGGDDQGDNQAGEEELRDIHAAGYVSALEAGVETVMASFSSWQGVKMHGHRGLLTGVLKERMGFDGFVVGDWNGHGQVPGCSNAGCAAAFNAGVDMFMVPEDWKALYEDTLEHVRSGEIPAERLDDAVRRILRVKLRAGLFDRPKPSKRPLAGRLDLLGSSEHRALARRAVRESLVLLKNQAGILPLAPDQRVLVAGDGADNLGKQAGGWTLTWQGTGNRNDDFPGATSIWDGIRETVEAAGGTAVLSPTGELTQTPDVAVVVFGEDPYAEFQGDRETVGYEGEADLALLRRLGAQGIPVVSVFLSGRPLWVNREINASDAFVAAWLPGSEGGGVADVLFRDAVGAVRHDFHGKLSFSWPRDPSQTSLNRGDVSYDPLFPYGYGLTYADAGDLPRLSEEVGGSAKPAGSRTVYFSAAPLEPWRLYLADAGGTIPVTGGPVTALASGALELRAADHRVQEDARHVRWSGGAPAEVYLAAEPVDLSRESNGDMALSFGVLVEQPPEDTVTLAMECGEGCGGTLDLTETLNGLTPGTWTDLRIALRCFETAGADMRHIDTPFRLATQGGLALAFSDVKLVSAAEGAAICP